MMCKNLGCGHCGHYEDMIYLHLSPRIMSPVVVMGEMVKLALLVAVAFIFCPATW